MMGSALMVIQFLSAAAAAGMDVAALIAKTSSMVKAKHDAGEELTQRDLNALLDQGDKLQAAAAKQFSDTLADANTPRTETGVGNSQGRSAATGAAPAADQAAAARPGTPGQGGGTPGPAGGGGTA